MDNFTINIKNLQHIQSLNYNIDFSKNGVHCIVGKNGVGKTTLIKAIQNLKESDTIDKMSRLNIVSEETEIKYFIEDMEINFTSIKIGNRYILDSKDLIDEEKIKEINVEFPAPKGKRFDTYEKLIKYGEDIKTSFSTNVYDERPTELIHLLKNIYDNTTYFDNLEQIKIKGEFYFIKPLNNENYIREDDFSSGEFMIIQIYKLIKKSQKIIIIDELDISLDSRAQVNLIDQLEKLCAKYKSNVVFTTHSLAIMKKVSDLEGNLYYMSNTDGAVDIQAYPYNYIKAELFQFTGYDKIILTEDKMLENYLSYIIKDIDILNKYKIVYVAGSSQTVSLMERNIQFNLFNNAEVVCVLDGDQEDNYSNREDVILLFEKSIEKFLYKKYEEGYFVDKKINTNSIIKANSLKKKASALYHEVIGKRHITNHEIFDLLINTNSTEANEFKQKIESFLTR